MWQYLAVHMMTHDDEFDLHAAANACAILLGPPSHLRLHPRLGFWAYACQCWRWVTQCWGARCIGKGQLAR
jgi:hypothetical protein